MLILWRGEEQKNKFFFFFTYDHQGLKMISWGDSYPLVMAYQGQVSIFMYLSPI